MTPEKYQAWSLRLAMALPVIVVAVVAALVYVPRFWTTPAQYDFVYTKNADTMNYTYSLQVENGQLVKEENAETPEKNITRKDPKIYRYHMATGESEQISLDEALALRYQNGTQSPDGYATRIGYSSGGGPFGGPNETAVYLYGHLTSKKLTLTGIDASNIYSFQFVGWVAK